MKEARSIANALFAFLMFLLLYALVTPGASHGRHGARFLRMQVEETHAGHTERHTFSVPTFVVHGFLRGASIGRFHREVDLEFDRNVPYETLKDAFGELQKSPDGTEVSRTIDEDTVVFRKDGRVLTVRVNETKEDGNQVVLRVPVTLAEGALSESRDLDAEAIIAGLREMGSGDLVDVQGHDTHVKIWLE